MNSRFPILMGAGCVMLASVPGCSRSQKPPAPDAAVVAAPASTQPSRNSPATETNVATAKVPFYTYELVAVLPHDPRAFTQGLAFFDDALLESTGLYGQSTLRKVDFKTGKVLQQLQVPADYFAEGMAVLDGKAFQLTWQNHKGFVYDLASFRLEKEFTYEGEGWGLTTDGHLLVLSDGTDQIRFLDPVTFEVKRTIRVTFQGRPVDRLNELEYIRGEIFANVWQTDQVVRVDPGSGRVVGVVDFTGLLNAQDRNTTTDVLNGIAYDAVNDRLFVTGKLWPRLFEVRLKLK